MDYTDYVVDFEVLLEGYKCAFERLQEARESVRPSGDATLLYIPLLEALNWTSIIEERLRRIDEAWEEKLPAHIDHLKNVIWGYRYARNSVHHEWSIAVCLTDEPEFLRDWCWKSTLPVGHKQERNRAAYENYLSGRALRHTFHDLHKLFRAASSLVNK